MRTPRDRSPETSRKSLFLASETVYRSTHRRTGAEIRGLSHSATDSRNLRECVVGPGGLELQTRSLRPGRTNAQFEFTLAATSEELRKVVKAETDRPHIGASPKTH